MHTPAAGGLNLSLSRLAEPFPKGYSFGRRRLVGKFNHHSV
jgi:hypothetical protein